MKLEWHRTPIRKSCSACGKEIQPTELRIVFTDVILNKKGNIHFHVACFDKSVEGCGYF